MKKWAEIAQFLLSVALLMAAILGGAWLLTQRVEGTLYERLRYLIDRHEDVFHDKD